MNQLGRQLILEFYGCDKTILNTCDIIEAVMLKAAKAAKATVIDHTFHVFSPHGVSGVVILAESHITAHTWPEHRYCAVDIFTCGDHAISNETADVIKAGLKADRYMVMEIKRGVNTDI